MSDLQEFQALLNEQVGALTEPSTKGYEALNYEIERTGKHQISLKIPSIKVVFVFDQERLVGAANY